MIDQIRLHLKGAFAVRIESFQRLRLFLARRLLVRFAQTLPGIPGESVVVHVNGFCGITAIVYVRTVHQAPRPRPVGIALCKGFAKVIKIYVIEIGRFGILYRPMIFVGISVGRDIILYLLIPIAAIIHRVFGYYRSLCILVEDQRQAIPGSAEIVLHFLRIFRKLRRQIGVLIQLRPEII